LGRIGFVPSEYSTESRLVIPFTVTVTSVEVADPSTSGIGIAVYWVVLLQVPSTGMPKKLNCVWPGVVLKPVPVNVTVVGNSIHVRRLGG
jgi:hypothetical protein